MNIDNKIAESKVYLNNPQSSPTTLAELENTLLGNYKSKSAIGYSVPILSFGSARFTSKSFMSKIKAAEEISSGINSLQLSPKTLARVENNESLLRSLGHKPYVQVMSSGSHRIGGIKDNCEEIVLQVKDLSEKKSEHIFAKKPLSEETLLEDHLQQLIKKILDYKDSDKSRINHLKAFIGAIQIMGCQDTLDSKRLIDSVFKKYDLGEPTDKTKEPSRLDLGDSCTENYIEEQSRLFDQSFGELYKKYSEQYVLFHDGEVLFSAKNFSEVAEVAYKKRKVKEIFIIKVSSTKYSHEVLTPLG
jgi:hypothetical protein